MPLEFASITHQFYYEQIKRQLDEIDGNYKYSLESPYFLYTSGSATVQIWVHPYSDSDCIVSVISWVVLGPNVSDPALLQYLLQKNMAMSIGVFGIDPDGDVKLTQNMLASSCDVVHLQKTIATLLTNADKYDDEIRDRWGGRRSSDRIDPAAGDAADPAAGDATDPAAPAEPAAAQPGAATSTAP